MTTSTAALYAVATKHNEDDDDEESSCDMCWLGALYI